MRKKLLILALAAVVGASSIPTGNILSSASAAVADQEDNSDAWDDDNIDGDYETVCGYPYPFSRTDFVVSPAQKTIKVGKSFTINLCLSADCEEEYGELSDEEWDALIKESIDGITFRSTKKSVASVNSKGKVKGKKKGSAVIITTLTFSDGSEGVYKTKVYVKGDDNDDDDDYYYDDVCAGPFSATDFVVSPTKKTIKVGKSFTINLYSSVACEQKYKKLSEEEWDALIEENIDDITFRSTKKSVASVNSKGKVKGKKKGSAIITTTLTFRDGSEGIYKTKVYVKK